MHWRNRSPARLPGKEGGTLAVNGSYDCAGMPTQAYRKVCSKGGDADELMKVNSKKDIKLSGQIIE